MTSCPVTLYLSFALMESVQEQPAAIEKKKNIAIHSFILSIINWTNSIKCYLIPNAVTSFSSSLIRLLFCLDFIFPRSISAVSSLFFLDNSTILVAATSPVKPDVPKQGQVHKSWRSCDKSITSHLCKLSGNYIIIPAKAMISSSLFFFRCLISKSFSLKSLKSRPFSSFSSLSWSSKLWFSFCSSL